MTPERFLEKYPNYCGIEFDGEEVTIFSISENGHFLEPWGIQEFDGGEFKGDFAIMTHDIKRNCTLRQTWGEVP